MCSDCETYGLKKHGLTRSDCNANNAGHFLTVILSNIFMVAQ